MRLIDADVLIAGRVENDPVVIAAQNAESIDAVPVIHGKWIDKGRYVEFLENSLDEWDFWEIRACSICGCTLYGREKKAYCSSCGAKMDLDSEI